jgi:hypothetical protein
MNGGGEAMESLRSSGGVGHTSEHGLVADADVNFLLPPTGSLLRQGSFICVGPLYVQPWDSGFFTHGWSGWEGWWNWLGWSVVMVGNVGGIQ